MTDTTSGAPHSSDTAHPGGVAQPVGTTHPGGGTQPVGTTHPGSVAQPVDTTHPGSGTHSSDTTHPASVAQPVDTTHPGSVAQTVDAAHPSTSNDAKQVNPAGESALAVPTQVQIAAWTNYHSISTVAMGVLTAASLVLPRKYPRVNAVINAIGMVLTEISAVFWNGIKAMEGGTMPDYSPPTNQQALPPVSGKITMLAGAWPVISVALENLLGRMAPTSALKAIVAGLRNSVPEVIRALAPAFG